MSLVRIRDTEEVIFKSEFEDRLRRSNVGIPSEGLNLEALDHHGADPVMEGPQPTGEPWQFAAQDGVEQINGQWFTKYVLAPNFETQEEHAAYDAQWQADQLKAQTPKEISHRQFYQALWENGERITYEEAEAAINIGTLPATIEAFVIMMTSDPATEREGKRARLALTGAKTFERDHYFVMIFAAMFGMTDLEIDALWRLAGSL